MSNIKKIVRIGNVRKLYPSGGGGLGDEEYTIVSDSGRITTRCKAGVALSGFFPINDDASYSLQEQPMKVIVESTVIAALARAYFNCMNKVRKGDFIYADYVDIGDEIMLPCKEDAERILDVIAERLRKDSAYSGWFENGFPRYGEDVDTFESEGFHSSNYCVLTRLTPEQVAYNRVHGLH